MINLLRIRPLALAPCLLLLLACPGKEGLLTEFDPSTTSGAPDTSTGGASSTSNGVSTADSSTAGLETEGAATDTTFDPEDPPPQTVTSFTGGEEQESEGSGGSELPDLCADLGCGADQLCVSPGSWCDQRQDPPEWVDQPAFCADFPADCESEPLPDFCLGEKFCVYGEPPLYADEHNVFCTGAPDCI